MGGQVAVDVVGHFGGRYAINRTAYEVACGLRDAGLLGSIHNLDEHWIEEYADLQSLDAKSSGSVSSAYALLFASPPYNIAGMYARRYGWGQTAIYMAPKGYGTAAGFPRAGRVFVPSDSCVDCFTETENVVVVPLGVSSVFADSADERIQRIASRSQMPPRVLHLTTHYTSFLEVWKKVRGSGIATVHVPHELVKATVYEAADHGLTDSVVVESPEYGSRGLPDSKLVELLDRADLLVATSAEAFGTTTLAALVAGVPVLTPFDGSETYLDDFGGWLPIPCGEAPNDPVWAGAVARVLGVALAPGARLRICHRAQEKREVDRWLWPAVRNKWVEEVSQWLSETAA